MKKAFSFLLVLAGLFFLTSNSVKAQWPAAEISIANTVSSSFYFEHHVVNCNAPGVYIGAFASTQTSNSGIAHFYNGVMDEYTYVLTVVDQWGNWVHVGAPGSGQPQTAVLPTGDKVIWHFFGCGHPSTIEIL